MTTSNDLKHIIKYLKSSEVKIDFTEFEFQVKSHPDFPSLLAFSDALRFFDIESKAIRVENINDTELPKKYIALLMSDKTELSFIEIKDDLFLKNGKTVEPQDLVNQWKGVVFFIIEDQFYEKDHSEKKEKLHWIITITALALLSIPIIETSRNELNSISILFLSLVGLLIGLETFKKSIGIKSVLTDGFCSATSNTSCDSIINSGKWSFLKKINLSDITVVFFLAQFTSLFVMSISGLTSTFFTLNSIGLWFVIPISMLSIYYQSRIEKKWCPLCLLIILVLYIELIYINFQIGELTLLPSSVALFIGINLLALVFWTFIKTLIVNNNILKQEQIKSNRFKRNYKLFKLALYSEKIIKDTSHTQALILGNKLAKVKIDLVTSPYCGYCDRAHSLIEEILSRYKDDIHICLWFNLDPKVQGNTRFVYRNLVQIYYNRGSDAFLNALKNWYTNRNFEHWKQEFEESIDVALVDDLLFSQHQWCTTNEFMFTPIITINNHNFPDTHKREDLIYYIEDLIEESSFDKIVFPNK